MSKAKKIALDKNLNSLMEKHNFSMSEFSRFCKINKSSVHNWVNGVFPKGLEPLIKVCEYFNITLDELIFNEATNELIPNINEEEVRFEIVIRKIK